MVDPNDAQDDSIVAQARYQVVEARRREWPRIELTRSLYHCEQALSAALHRLEEPDKRLLELHFLAGLSIDQLGRIYAIDPFTAARRLNRILLCLRTTIHVLVAPKDARSGPLPHEKFCANPLRCVTPPSVQGSAPAHAERQQDEPTGEPPTLLQ